MFRLEYSRAENFKILYISYIQAYIVVNTYIFYIVKQINYPVKSLPLVTVTKPKSRLLAKYAWYKESLFTGFLKAMLSNRFFLLKYRKLTTQIYLKKINNCVFMIIPG